jgi:hypothetical protein
VGSCCKYICVCVILQVFFSSLASFASLCSLLLSAHFPSIPSAVYCLVLFKSSQTFSCISIVKQVCTHLVLWLFLLLGPASWCRYAKRDHGSRDEQDICPSDGTDWQFRPEAGQVLWLACCLHQTLHQVTPAQSGVILRKSRLHIQQGWGKSWRNLSQDSKFPCWDMNPEPSEL